jgi:nitrate reductase (cytochrome)
MTRRIPELQRAVPRAYVELHPEDARELGIHRGELVRIESRRGQIDLPLVNQGRGEPPRGQVFVPFFDETKLINEVTLEAYDPFSRQPDYKKCAVKVYRSPANHA